MVVGFSIYGILLDGFTVVKNAPGAMVRILASFSGVPSSDRNRTFTAAFALRTIADPGARKEATTLPETSSSVPRTKFGTGTPLTSFQDMPSMAKVARTRTSTIFWLVKPDGKSLPLKSVIFWNGDSFLTM